MIQEGRVWYSKMYINITKESKKLYKMCTFSSLIRSYDHLYAMHDNNKIALVLLKYVAVKYIVCEVSTMHCGWSDYNALCFNLLKCIVGEVIFVIRWRFSHLCFYQTKIWTHSIWYEYCCLTQSLQNPLVLWCIQVRDYTSLSSYNIL